MATLTASAAQSNVPAKMMINGTVNRVVSYTLAAALSAGDVIQMLKVPSGANINNLRLTTDLFGGGNATIAVGDGVSTSRYIPASGTSSSLAVALIINPSALGYSYSVEDTIDILVTAVASGSAVGVITIAVSYTNDN